MLIKKYKRIVTVFTDASFCHKTLAAGYAIWMKTDEGTHRHAAPFKVAISNPEEAETAALANGIIWAATKFNLRSRDYLVAASDCKNAIARIKIERKLKNDVMTSVVLRVRKEIAGRGFKLSLRYVPAHRGYGTKRTAVNEWCDISAKKVMRNERLVKGLKNKEQTNDN
jgi:ribonuclease HI